MFAVHEFNTCLGRFILLVYKRHGGKMSRARNRTHSHAICKEIVNRFVLVGDETRSVKREAQL